MILPFIAQGFFYCPVSDLKRLGPTWPWWHTRTG